MDVLITMVRFPVGLAVIPVVATLWLLVAPLEFIAGIIVLPFAAIAMSRSEIKSSWLGQWPYITLRRIPKDTEKIWAWIFGN